MEIIQIKEESDKAVREKKTAVGIDFGTTNSLIAHISNGLPKILVQIPTIISKDGLIGEGEIRSVKRLIGKSPQEINLTIGNKKLAIKEAIALVIEHLKSEAEKQIGKIDSAVITVPAHFDDMMRSCVKEAAEMTGMEILRLISEPTAAAYAYGLEERAEGKYAIYDLGGGTFDISLLRMKMGVFQVLSTDGNNMLGGDDIDYAISEYFKVNLPKDFLIQEARKAKEHLTENEFWENKESGLSLSLEEFEKIAYQVIEPSIEATKNIIKDHDIKGIILVGGSTKMRLVKKLLSGLSPQIFDNIDPDESVAIGAAFQAHNLTTGSKDLIIDVVPLSLGMEIMGGIMERLSSGTHLCRFQFLRNLLLMLIVKQRFRSTFIRVKGR